LRFAKPLCAVNIHALRGADSRNPPIRALREEISLGVKELPLGGRNIAPPIGANGEAGASPLKNDVCRPDVGGVNSRPDNDSLKPLAGRAAFPFFVPESPIS
jgi:hypothetical protein